MSVRERREGRSEREGGREREKKREIQPETSKRRRVKAKRVELRR